MLYQYIEHYDRFIQRFSMWFFILMIIAVSLRIVAAQTVVHAEDGCLAASNEGIIEKTFHFK